MDLGAQAKALLDEYESLLPDDGLTRQQRIDRARAQMRAEQAELRRTRQPYMPWRDTEGRPVADVHLPEDT